MDLKEKIKSVIGSLSQSVTAQNVEENQGAFDVLKASYEENPGQFLDLLDIANYKFEMLLEGVFDIPEQENDYMIKFIINGLYEHFHETRIELLEGSACCADKSGFIRRMTLKALETRSNLSLYQDYMNVEQITKNKEKQAYWSPTSVKDTDEAMALFWDWYQLRSN